MINFSRTWKFKASRKIIRAITIVMAAEATAIVGSRIAAMEMHTVHRVNPSGAPILQQLVDSGWKPNADLHATILPHPLTSQSATDVDLFDVPYDSHTWRGQKVRIFGFYAVPKTASAAKRAPGLLLVHGGGGYATVDRAVDAAQRGFAALAIDLPGKGTRRENVSRSTGPDMTVPQIFTVEPAVADSYIYHAVIAEIRSITFLSSRPEVDSQRIGMVGASWGGATGLLATSLDHRIRCFVDLFGSGDVRDGSCWLNYFQKVPQRQMAVWEANYDASRYVSRIHVPVLGVLATNDGCYWLPNFMKTMEEISPKPEIIAMPNENHKLTHEAREGYYEWLREQLQGIPESSLLKAMAAGAAKNDRTAQVHVIAGSEAYRVVVSYSPADGTGWTRRKWTTIALRPAGKGAWTADIPFGRTCPTTFFATAYAGQNAMQSTSLHTIQWSGTKSALFITESSGFGRPLQRRVAVRLGASRRADG